MQIISANKKSHFIRGTMLVAAAVLCIPTVQAAQYQTEAGILYEATDVDPNDDITIIGIAGTYYFAPIDVKGPLAEAEFLAKASGVGAGYLSADADIGNTNVDGNGYYLGIKYVVPGPDLVLGLIVDSIDLSGGGADLESSSTTFQIGKYVSDTALLGFSYMTGTQSITGQPDNDLGGIEFSGKMLTKMNGKAVSLNASFGQESYDYGSGNDGTNTILSIGGDYYVDDTLGIGAGYATNSGDDSSTEGSTLSFNITKFVTNTTSILFGYETFLADSADDSTTLTLGISARF